MRSPKDFFKPLAVGAPEPLREIPFRPSRVIHFFPPQNEKVVAKLPEIIPTVDVLLGNLEDAIPMADKEAARAGLVKVAKNVDLGDTQLWTRVNSLDSPWGLDDLTTLVTEIGDKLDVIMMPKVEGAEDIHYVDRLLAQLEAKAGLTKPLLIHAILETARGVANIEEICAASPRMQGLCLGPADLAANRRMKTTRVGGGHPDYVVRVDPDPDDPDAPRPTYQQDLWHYTLARMVDACVATGSCRSTGRSATSRTPWPARTSSATPTCSAASARGACTPCRSRSPSGCSARGRPTCSRPSGSSTRWATAPARSCSTARWRTTPPSSSATWWSSWPRQLAERDPELAAAYGFALVTAVRRAAPAPSVLYMPAANERALEKAKAIAGRRDHLRPRGRRGSRRQGRRPPEGRGRGGSGEYGNRELTIRCNGLDTQWGADDLAAAASRAPRPSSSRRSPRWPTSTRWPHGSTPPARRPS